jgi:hypothetical protein
MMFAYGPLLKSARWRIFFIGLSVNMKVYLISGVLIHLVKRRWLWTELAVISIVMVYIVSYLLFGDGTPKQIVDNLINFATGAKASQLLDFWYPNTYVALRYVLGESDAPVNNFLGSDQVNQILLAMTWSTRTAQAVILAATAATWFRPELVPTYRLTLLGLSFAMITTETSAYTQPLLFLFVFMEPWKGWLRSMAISSVYLLCLPGDIGLGSSGAFHEFSYLWQRYVTADRFLAVGMFTRPLILMLPSTFLGLHTILVVAKDIRDHGWRSPWRYAMPGFRLRPRSRREHDDGIALSRQGRVFGPAPSTGLRRLLVNGWLGWLMLAGLALLIALTAMQYQRSMRRPMPAMAPRRVC